MTATTAKPASAAFIKHRRSDFFADNYKTLIHSAYVPIGHSTSTSHRYVVTSATYRTPCMQISTNLDSAPSHVPLDHGNPRKPRHQAFRHHSWPLPVKAIRTTGRWGGAGLLGVAEVDLERLKRERRAKRAAKQKQKQVLRGEIDSWELNNSGTKSSKSSIPIVTSWESTEGTTPHGWTSDACAPVSDEEWGEDGDYGGLPADLSELMVVDEDKEANWWNVGEDVDVRENEKDAWETFGLGTSDSGFTITLPPSTEAKPFNDRDLLSDSNKEQTSTDLGMALVVDSARDPHTDLAESPPLLQKDMFTPLSPALSPEPFPSAMDMTDYEDMRSTKIHTPKDTLFSTFSAIRLNTPRKRQHPDDAMQEANADGTLDANTFECADQDSHPKKKRSPGVD